MNDEEVLVWTAKSHEDLAKTAKQLDMNMSRMPSHCVYLYIYKDDLEFGYLERYIWNVASRSVSKSELFFKMRVPFQVERSVVDKLGLKYTNDIKVPMDMVFYNGNSISSLSTWKSYRGVATLSLGDFYSSEELPIKCECGSEIVGAIGHDSYCPKWGE